MGEKKFHKILGQSEKGKQTFSFLGLILDSYRAHCWQLGLLLAWFFLVNMSVTFYHRSENVST